MEIAVVFFFFYIIREDNPEISMNPQKTPNNQTNPEKEKLIGRKHTDF